MRRLGLLAAALVLFAGCAAPVDEEDDPLVGLCPAWLQGPGEAAAGAHLGPARNVSVEIAPPPGPDSSDPQVAAGYIVDGRSLDLVRVRIAGLAATDGLVELRAHSGDRQLVIRDYREETAQLKPSVVLGPPDAGQEFDVLLSPITHGSAPQPGSVRLEWSFSGVSLDSATADVTATATFHYRVCGV